MPHITWPENEKKETISDGEYLCRIDNVIEKKSKTDKDMFSVRMTIETEGPYYGRKLYHNLVFAENTMWLVKMFYEAALGKELSGEYDCTPEELEGRYIKVTVKGSTNYGPVLNKFEATENSEDIPF